MMTNKNTKAANQFPLILPTLQKRSPESSCRLDFSDSSVTYCSLFPMSPFS